LLSQIAWAAIHTKDTFFAGLFARLLPRIEGKGAAWAVAHRTARRLLNEFARAGLDAKQRLEQSVTLTA
jgi:hypothetical protein